MGSHHTCSGGASPNSAATSGDRRAELASAGRRSARSRRRGHRVTPGSRGQGDGDLGGDSGVVLGEREVGRHARAGGLGTDAFEHERGDPGPRHPGGVGGGQGLVERTRRAPPGRARRPPGSAPRATRRRRVVASTRGSRRPRRRSRRDAPRARRWSACRRRGTSRRASRAPARRSSRGAPTSAAGRGRPWPRRTRSRRGARRSRRGRRTRRRVTSEPRCTPPMPPVANARTPARWASATVADTVVTPTSHRWAAATPRSRSATLRLPDSTRATSSPSTPTRHTPSITAVIAGTAPAARIAPVQRVSAAALCGSGRPRLEKMVDSSATTGRCSAMAVATSSDTANGRFLTGVLLVPGGRRAGARCPPSMIVAMARRLRRARRAPRRRGDGRPSRR